MPSTDQMKSAISDISLKFKKLHLYGLLKALTQGISMGYEKYDHVGNEKSCVLECEIILKRVLTMLKDVLIYAFVVIWWWRE